MKIYTKTGDNGETGFIGGRIKKDSLRIECLGSIDELNAAVGVVMSRMKNYIPTAAENSFLREDSNGDSIVFNSYASELQSIQSILFSIGALVAGAKMEIDLDPIILKFEKDMDQMEIDLPTLQNFILPGGSEVSAYLHFTRAVCRRAERSLVKYLNESEDIKLASTGVKAESKSELNKDDFKKALKYLNRLSDYFFVLARYTNKLDGIEDVIWKNPKA